MTGAAVGVNCCVCVCAVGGDVEVPVTSPTTLAMTVAAVLIS